MESVSTAPYLSVCELRLIFLYLLLFLCCVCVVSVLCGVCVVSVLCLCLCGVCVCVVPVWCLCGACVVSVWCLCLCGVPGVRAAVHLCEEADHALCYEVPQRTTCAPWSQRTKGQVHTYTQTLSRVDVCRSVFKIKMVLLCPML